MNMVMHEPSMLWACLAAVPIIALWFLRLRRDPQRVPSLALWRVALEDRSANAPFQRLKRHLQLLLQLAALLAVVLAATQIAFSSSGSANQRVLVAVDVSASMSATVGGDTRLDEARRLVAATMAAAGPGREVCLMSFDRAARRIVPFSDDPNRLQRALAALRPAYAGSDPAAALRLMRAISSSEPYARAVLVTDAVLPALIDEDLACPLEILRTAPAGANLGITALSARRRADSAWDMAITVSSAGAASAGAVLTVQSDGRELFTRAVAPTGLSDEQVTIRVSGGPFTVQTKLQARGDDACAFDDEVWLALPAPDPASAWVSPGLPRWRTALAVQPALRLRDDPAGCDLIVSERAADLDRPARVRFGVGHAPRELVGMVAISDDDRGSRVVDVRRTHPLLAHLTIDNLAIAQRIVWIAHTDEHDAEQRGWSVLVHGDAGPLLVERQRPNGVDWSLLPHSDRSDLSYRLAFPVLCSNLALATLRATGRGEVSAIATGILPGQFVGAGSVRITGAGTETRSEAGGDGVLVGVEVGNPGLWRLVGTQHTVVIGSGLLDSKETRLQPSGTVRAREVAVSEGGVIPGEFPLWPWLVAIALLCILAEWWVVNRPPHQRV